MNFKTQPWPLLAALMLLATLLWVPIELLAHGVSQGDQGIISTGSGRMFFPYLYMGAKHMVTGYDHLLFLLGVVFFLYKMRDVALYVTLFAIGHTITMLTGVLAHIHINAYLIDAVIGFSVIYKAADNLGLWEKWFGRAPDARIATLVFGLLHGFGLATKIQEFSIPDDGLLFNLLSFSIGVEAGQLLALAGILILMGFWRRKPGFMEQAKWANYMLMLCGAGLMCWQLLEFFSH